MEYKTNDILINSYYFHIKEPVESVSDQIYCLIHGWSGNEKSMEIFSSAIPGDSLIIFPRGPLLIGQNKFGWTDVRNDQRPNFDDYARLSTGLMRSLQELTRTIQTPSKAGNFNLIGFSQGAAMSAVLSILYPQMFNKVALLSGFLPSNPPVLKRETLSTLKYYIAHGTQDQLVDFERSIKLKNYLEDYAAETRFCQEDLGHKIGTSYLKNLKLFFQTERLSNSDKRK